MEKFRIKIDLSAFFDDEQKLVFILVDPSWETVKCLQKRVEKIFDVDNLRFITNEGCFLPPQESIEVIKPNDFLKAFIPSESLLNKNKKRKKAQELLQESLDHKYTSTDDSSKKRKFRSIEAGGFTSSTPNTAKRCKNIIQLSSVAEITSTNDQLGHLQKIKSTTKDYTNTKQELEDPLQEEHNNCTSSPLQRDLSNKRKRKKKRSTDSVIQVKPDPVEAPLQVATSTLLNSSELINQTKNKTSTPTDSNKRHIYFNETGETVTTTTKNNSTISKSVYLPVKDSPPKISFHCSIANLTKVPRMFSLKRLEDTTLNANTDSTTNTNTSQINNTSNVMTIKQPITIQECIVINPPVTEDFIKGTNNEEKSEENLSKLNPSEEEADITDDSSVIAIESEEENSPDSKNSPGSKNYTESEDISEVIDLNMSDEEHHLKITKSETHLTNTSDEVQIQNILPFSTDLNSLPSNGSIVIFKVIREDRNISGYIAGKCEYTNKRTKNIKMLIIDGLNEIKGIPKKYVCPNFDDSINSEKQYLQVKLNEMREAKVFEMN